MNFKHWILSWAVLAIGAAVASATEVAPESVNFNDTKVSAPVTTAPGDPINGAAVYKDRSLGNCLACHANKAMKDELFHGNVGPVIDGVADRYSAEQIRAIIVNSKKVFGPDTIMPGFYTLEVGKNVRDNLVGKTILTAQQVEDVVAYLMTLK